MAGRSTYILVNDRVRSNAAKAIADAPVGYRVTIAEPGRTGDQNAKLHAICSDLAVSPLAWAGKRRDKDEWKMLLVSAHAVATNEAGEVIPGLEGEFVAIRESTARMSVKRASSLIEYAIAFCAMNGVDLKTTRERGFMDSAEAAA